MTVALQGGVAACWIEIIPWPIYVLHQLRTAEYFSVAIYFYVIIYLGTPCIVLYLIRQSGLCPIPKTQPDQRSLY